MNPCLTGSGSATALAQAGNGGDHEPSDNARRALRQLRGVLSVLSDRASQHGVAPALATGDWLWLPAAVICGYGFAWVGHFFFEKNRPATFRHPIYSLMGDWVMFKDICTGRIPL